MDDAIPISNAAKDNHDKEEKQADQVVYILGADFGSTSLSVKLYDDKANIVGNTSVKIPYVDLCQGGVEIEPIIIWELFVDTVKQLFSSSNTNIYDIKTMGFSFQRGTVMLWDKETGEPCCNLISWQDTRCAPVVDEMNRRWMKKTINMIGAMSYALFKKAKFMLMKALQFQVTHSSMKLVWLLKNNPKLLEDVHCGKVLFGSLDTWIIWKLTNGRKHVTDYTCASGTGMFDPYLLEWSSIVPYFFNIPLEIFPAVIDTSGWLAETEKDIFGKSIPITAIAGDSPASLFGLMCFQPGEISCVMGTGCFMDINTGSHPHASISGLYPVIGWKMEKELVNVSEACIGGIAPSIEWAKTLGFFDDVNLMSDIAKSVKDADGMYFVPGFSGLTAPHQDPTACAGLIGVKRSTTKAHIVRAILEGIAFRFFELHQVAREETNIPFHDTIKVTGGISNNEFLLEMISSLTNRKIEKSNDSDVSLTGAVYLAGLGAGIWKSKEEIMSLQRSTTLFEPNPLLRDKYLPVYKEWSKAVQRCMHWYTS